MKSEPQSEQVMFRSSSSASADREESVELFLVFVSPSDIT